MAQSRAAALRWPVVRRRRERRPPVGPGEPTRVLVISASMGAGHDGAARSSPTGWRAAGHHAEVRDFLDSGPLRIGAALRSGYEFELKHVPSAYEATYRLWYRVPWLCPLVAWLVTVLTRRRVLRWVRQCERRRGRVHLSLGHPLPRAGCAPLGRLAIPTVNFITDFGVHPLWVHRGIDVNLAVHDGPGGDGRPPHRTTLRWPAGRSWPRRSSPAPCPLASGPEPGSAWRAAERAVLVVAGSWGVGRRGGHLAGPHHAMAASRRSWSAAGTSSCARR